MARSVLSGIALGAVVSVVMAVAVSLLVPLSPQPAPEIGEAEGIAPPPAPQSRVTVTVAEESDSDTSQPRVNLPAPVEEQPPREPTPAARAPQVSTQAPQPVAPTPPQAAPATPPQSETAPTTPAPPQPVETVRADSPPVQPQTKNAPQPQTDAAVDLPPVQPLPDTLTARVEEDAPVLPNPQALAPMIPDDTADVAVRTDPAAPPTVADPPAAENAEQDTATGAETGQTQTTQVTRPRLLPVPTTQGAQQSAGTRPRVGIPASTLIPRAPQSGEAAAGADTATSEPEVMSQDPATLSPIRRYGQAFENPDGKPLMSIVLIDAGVDLDRAEVGLPALGSFPYPVSFAVDASLPDARARMERYRAEGFDVLAMVDLPQGARPSDAEVSLSVALNTMPEAVGVLEGTGGGLQPSREVADQVTAILSASGHGLVTQNSGLNSMPKLAVKRNVPASPIFRDFDGADQTARVIRRFLDQAAFKADQEGGVIMLGRLRSETIKALLVWGLADRANSVALAPVSALLLAQR